MSLTPYAGEVPAEKVGHLVVLSGAGMPVKKRVKEAAAWYPDSILSVDWKSRQEERCKEKPKQEKPKTKLSYNQKRLLEILPHEIDALESQIKAIESKLYSNTLSANELQELSLELEAKKALCEEKTMQYFELEEKQEGF